MRKPFRLLSSVWVSEIQIKLCKPWRWEKKLPDRRFGTGGRFGRSASFPFVVFSPSSRRSTYKLVQYVQQVVMYLFQIL